VLALAREVGAAVFTVGLGPRIDSAVLEQLAALSGGHAYVPADVAELGMQFGRIIENLRQRYVVSYSSTNFDRNGEWRAVQIKARTPGLVVTSSEGYFAPGE
jgi:Ca-activated chloride channel family protein